MYLNTDTSMQSKKMFIYTLFYVTFDFLLFSKDQDSLILEEGSALFSASQDETRVSYEAANSLDQRKRQDAIPEERE